MSEAATKVIGEPGDALGGFEIEINDERTASVELAGTPDNRARIDVRLEGGRQWVFGVNGDVATLLLVLNQNGQRVDDDLPSWIEPLVRRLGLEGIDS